MKKIKKTPKCVERPSHGTYGSQKGDENAILKWMKAKRRKSRKLRKVWGFCDRYKWLMDQYNTYHVKRLINEHKK